MMEFFRKRMRDDRGFTLIELMVVVLIIGILIAIGLPTFLGLRKRAQDRAAQSDLRNGIVAAKAFYTDKETYNGFNAAQGQLIEPSLAWVDGGSAAADTGPYPLHVVSAASNVVRLERKSASGQVFTAYDDVQQGTVICTGPTGTYAGCVAAKI